MTSYQKIEFPSGDQACAGWFLRAEPEGGAAAPCVIFGHGFCGVKEARLDAYAERFAQAGYNALVFDYRHFGESPGSPRQLLDIRKQQEDWHAAISYARSLQGINSDRIVLWGTSFSGGHVIEVAVKDGNISAVITLVPHVNGIATAGAAGPVQGARLGLAALRDLFRKMTGRSPFYIPAFGKPGDLAAITAPGAFEASRKLFPEHLGIDESVAARVFLSIPFFSPGRLALQLSVPWLVQVAELDQITPPQSAVKVASKAPKAELITYPVDHLDVYMQPYFEQIAEDQIDFLNRHI